MGERRSFAAGVRVGKGVGTAEQRKLGGRKLEGRKLAKRKLEQRAGNNGNDLNEPRHVPFFAGPFVQLPFVQLPFFAGPFVQFPLVQLPPLKLP
jgi:hypothetical protein